MVFRKKQPKSIEKGLIESFNKIREEFDDHKGSINDNTNEIQMTYEYACEIDNKISKLSERMDEFQYLLECIVDSSKKGQKPSKYMVSPNFTLHEQELFLSLYTLPENLTLTYLEIGRKIGLTVKMVKGLLTAIKQKGVPIKDVKVNNETGYYLDKEFRDYQTKNNVIKINEKLIKNF